jgi:hypothetical protein
MYIVRKEKLDKAGGMHLQQGMVQKHATIEQLLQGYFIYRRIFNYACVF